MKWIGLVGLALAGFACNMISGADNIRIADDDDEASSESGVVFSGSGGATTGASSGGATSSSNGQQAAVNATASSSTGTVEPCTYPAGPYGVAQGQVVPPTLTWQGFAPGSSTPTTISIQDVFDCDGSKGIHAVMIDTSQFG